jgi:hypothetical protein
MAATGCRQPPPPAPVAAAEPTQAELDQLLPLIAGSSKKLPAFLQAVHQPVWVGLRRSGALVGQAWGEGPGSWGDNLQLALSQARPGAGTVESVDVCLCHSSQPLLTGRKTLDNLEIARGVLGLELSIPDHWLGPSRHVRYAPIPMVSENQTFEAAASTFVHRSPRDRLALPGDLTVGVFSAYQAEVFLTAPRAVSPLYRAHSTDAPGDLSGLLAGLRRYLLHSVGREGTFAYLYSPGKDEVSFRGQLLVRPMLALWALGQMALDPQAVKVYRRAAESALRRYFRRERALGYTLDEQGEACLGDLSVLGLALLEGPDRSRHNSEIAALRDTVLHLQQSSGAFQTYLKPASKTVGVDYYPGEALVFLAALYEHKQQPALRIAIMKAFRYYRNWFSLERNRHPAFIPWQTQAYVRLWRFTHDPELRNFIFEMNDDLLSMQQWEGAAYPDFRGQFWKPERLDYGRLPHVSSTGVYLESLALARQLAGPGSRRQAYSLALERGFASVSRHQFRTRADLYYALKPEVVRGGLRSTMFDSRIRIDSVAENWMAGRAAHSPPSPPPSPPPPSPLLLPPESSLSARGLSPSVVIP